MRIITLNIAHFDERHGAWPARRELILGALRDADADIVALQAVGRKAGEDQASELARLLPGYPYVHYACAEGEPALGLALLARTRPLEVEAIPLSYTEGLEDPFHRVILRAAFDAGTGGRLQLFNCHFSWVAAQCVRNVLETLAVTQTHPGRHVLVGDMNAAPEAPAMTLLARAGFVDAWDMLRRDEPGPTFRADDTKLRIDYVWCGGLDAGRLRCIDRVAKAAAAAPVWPSDHCGLLADFDL